MSSRGAFFLSLLGSVAFAAALHACSADDGVSQPRTTGNGGSTGNGGGSGSGTGGTGVATGGNSNSNGNGGTGAMPGSTFLGSGGSTGSGGSVGNGGSAGRGGSTGVGGSLGAGGASGVGGSSTGLGGGIPLGMNSTFATNGFGMTTEWHGYAFTGTFGSATVMPVCGPTTTAAMPCFSMSGMQLCASGTVAADALGTSGQNGAFIGWNLNQAQVGVNPVMTVATTGAGLAIQVSGTILPTMRVAILASGAVGAMQWCAPLPTGGSGTIAWSSFATMCYTPGAGTAYTVGTPIAAVQILVPSTSAPVPFNFCLISAASVATL